MAFNPFSTFQKNRKFWMASILMVCMVTFIFCTGGRDVGDALMKRFRPRGASIATIGGHSVTREELYELKEQRNLANMMMVRCADYAFKKLSKIIFENSKDEAGKDNQKRQQMMAELEGVRMSLAYRKARPRYFDSGVKLDDLLEFKLWQAQADKMGIWLADDHFTSMVYDEFFSGTSTPPRMRIMNSEEIARIEIEVRRESHGATPDKVRRALMEEFRVRIAQYAVMAVQPWSFYVRQARGDEMPPPKYTFPDMPDEIRAPMTPEMLWEFYKDKRSEFDVTLIPIHVDNFTQNMREPTDGEKKEFFDRNKNKPYDPAAGDMGLEIPTQIKIAYVFADPASPAYLNQAKAKELLDWASPLAYNPLESSVVTAVRYVGAAQAEKERLQRQYDSLIRDRVMTAYLTAPYNASDCATPILAYLAKQHPQAAASLVASAFLVPTDRGISSLAGYLAWGMGKEDEAVFQAGMRAELERRAPFYAAVFAMSTARQPLELILPLAALDVQPRLPVEVVQDEMRKMIAERRAEEWARESMTTVRARLEGAQGNEEKFKRELKTLVPELHLTYGPPDADKDKYYSRFTIDGAKELAPLKDAYVKYMHRINFYEGRDTRPDTMLKPDDFYKLFFDSEQPFAAMAKFRAMPWPPSVAPNSDRLWKSPDPRVFDLKNLVQDEQENFIKHVQGNDPNRQIPAFDMFSTAEKPILFWRTDEVFPLRLSDYDEIGKKLTKADLRLKKAEKGLAEAAKQSDKQKLLKEVNDAKIEQSDLKEIQKRVVTGWKFDRARVTEALPKAGEIAAKLIKRGNDLDVIKVEANALKHDTIVLPRVADWNEEPVGGRREVDYFDYPLPKDKIPYPRDDMVKQLVQLYDLKAPISIGNDELDKINKERYDQADKKPGDYVQVLTNKPRSIFYVAVVTRLPNSGPSEFGRFADSIRMAPIESQFFRDNFVKRAQQEEGKLMRAGIVRDLGRVLGYDVEGAELAKARQDFDKGGGD